METYLKKTERRYIMNETNKTLLEAEIQSQLEALKDMEVGSDEYKATIDGLTKLIDRSVKESEVSQTLALKTAEVNKDAQLKKEQMWTDCQIRQEQTRKENIRGWVNAGIGLLGLIIPTAVTIWGTKKSFEFERDGSITTIMGRGFIQKLLPKNKN